MESANEKRILWKQKAELGRGGTTPLKLTRMCEEGLSVNEEKAKREKRERRGPQAARPGIIERFLKRG